MAFDFEWDETKRIWTIEERGLDFIDCGVVFENPHIEGLARKVNGERRHMVTGVLEDLYVTLIFTWRGDAIRIISMRSARRGEREKYREVFVTGTA